ncbi:hypothetical protein B0H11DRAFT_1904692 [Mycena galericulata]|nr:hypothetical protein B0H11DRAFT_1904692 [Mycena galericulata]
MDVDGWSADQLNIPPYQINVPPDQQHSPGPDELCIPEHLPDISEATVFPNPFLDPHLGNLYREFGALIITGLAGIECMTGKTALLAVIFWLRVAANLPTAYITDPDVVLVYTGTDFFILTNPTFLPAALEQNTWVLVDSNVRNVDPPQAVIDSGRFIVQAASPRASRTQSSLQLEQRTGADMHAFFQKFGGSARHVYDESHQLPAFDDQVKEAAATLVNDTQLIMRVIQLRAPNRSIDDKIGHMLELLAAKQQPLDLLDKHHHWFIGEGGRWPLRKFMKSPLARSGAKANLWRAQDEDCDKVLLADGRMSIETVFTANQQHPKALAVIRTPTSQLKVLHEHQFYRPRESNFPTFDSFYVDRSQHAFVFQASEADKTHSVNDRGRVWMEGHGIKEFTYIYVSGPKMDKHPTISLPVEHESQFVHIYHLVLDYPEVRTLLDTKISSHS